MNQFLLGCLLVLGSFIPLLAGTRTDVNIIEATENIRFLSQEITKDYFYFYANPGKKEIKQEIVQELEELVKSIRTISISTDSVETKNILEFLVYSKNQIDDLVKGEASRDKAALMLDYSETLLEGANSIAKEYSYDFSNNEKMLMKSKQIEFLIERSAKYYMALGIGLKDDVNRKQMFKALKDTEADIQAIQAYDYPKLMIPYKERMLGMWSVTKSLINRWKGLFASNLVVLAGKELESVTEQFVIYHRKTK